MISFRSKQRVDACAFIVIATILLAASVCTAFTSQTGDFLDEIDRLTDLVFDVDSNRYVPPTTSEQQTFSLLTAAVMAGNTSQADTLASSLDYRVVKFTDTVSGDTYWELRERLVNGDQTRGWGSYFINRNAKVDAVIEAPHLKFDNHTEVIAARAFRDSDVYGLAINGAHRNANGQGTADVAALTESIFLAVHGTWVTAASPRLTVQVHGFGEDNDGHEDFPNPTDMVVSNGDGDIDSYAILFDAELGKKGFASYVYNTLPRRSSLNMLVNGNIDGETFSSLAATHNVQGKYSRSIGASFVHIETEMDIRNSTSGLNNTTAALDAAFATMVPEPVCLSVVIFGLVLLLPRRHLTIAAPSTPCWQQGH